jgi:hypothetical protein
MIVDNIKCDDPYRYYKDKIGGLYRIIDAKEDYIKRLEDKIASLESTLRKLS